MFTIHDAKGAPTTEMHDVLHTETIVTRLREIEDGPWGDLHGRLLDARGLARRLKVYGISSSNLRIDGRDQAKGYHCGDLLDAWDRYLPVPSPAVPSQPSHTSQPSSDAVSAGTDTEAGTAASVPPEANVPADTPADQHRDGWDGWDASTGRGAGTAPEQPVCQRCGQLSAYPLIKGRCRTCAYPAGGSGDEPVERDEPPMPAAAGTIARACARCGEVVYALADRLCMACRHRYERGLGAADATAVVDILGGEATT